MTSEMGALFNEHRRQRQAKRAYNRDNSARLLRERGVGYESRNDGAHLIVRCEGEAIDFWPGTGKWRSRCGKFGFGVRKLLAFLGKEV